MVPAHQAAPGAVNELVKSIKTANFFSLASSYSGVVSSDGTRTTIDHSPEQWITIRMGGHEKTVLDFYQAPDVVRTLESQIEKLADSFRYTGRRD